MTQPLYRIRIAILGTVTALVLGACAEPGEVPEACHDTPSRESNCRQYHSSWEPEWKEAQTALPPLPRGEDLVAIDAPNGAPGYRYAVDKVNVTRGKDDVMRYTVRVESGSGAVNIFHEGMRCLTAEVRTYAYATNGGKAFRRMNNDWSPLAARGARGYQDFLYEAIMCDRNGYAWSEQNVVKALTSRYTAGGVLIERFCGNRQNCEVTGHSQ